MTAAELLRAAAEDVTAETWCQGAYAIRQDGQQTDDYLHPEACAWCAEGHLLRSQFRTWLLSQHRPPAERVRFDARRVIAARHALERDHQLHGRSLADWNDVAGRQAEDVRALFLRVAAALEAQAQLDEVLQ